MGKLILIFCLLLSSLTFAQEKKKVIYKYKKFESFDFESMRVDADSSAPGDISINPRFSVEFKNKLPQKPVLDKEFIDSVDWIQ
jgi:hypothetical protein